MVAGSQRHTNTTAEAESVSSTAMLASPGSTASRSGGKEGKTGALPAKPRSSSVTAHMVDPRSQDPGHVERVYFVYISTADNKDS